MSRSMYVSVLESCKGSEGGNYDENPKQCASNALSTFIPYCYTGNGGTSTSTRPSPTRNGAISGVNITSTSRMRGSLLPNDGGGQWLANPEDTLRFLALRLHGVGMIKSSPQ